MHVINEPERTDAVKLAPKHRRAAHEVVGFGEAQELRGPQLVAAGAHGRLRARRR